MDAKRLLYFRSIVEAGSLTEAARLLQITPGSLSKSIRNLESELGHLLFSRVGRTLQLTEMGRRTHAASDRLMDEYIRFQQTVAAAPEPAAEVLRIASFEPFTTHALGEATEGELSQLELRVVDLDVSEIGTAVASRAADLGLTYLPYPARELHFRKLCRIEFGIFVRAGAFHRTPFPELPFVAPVSTVSGSTVAVQAVDSWPESRVARRIQYRTTSLESALELVRRGRCAVFIPVFIAALQNRTVREQLRLRRVPSPNGVQVDQTVYLITRKENSDDPRIRLFGRRLRDAVSIKSDP